MYQKARDSHLSRPASRHVRPRPGTGAAGLIWTRPPQEKLERPAREAIVAAATGLAGTRGLDAMSIRGLSREPICATSLS